MEQQVTFQETLHTLHLLWADKTSFASYGKKGETTKKQVYQETLGKKARHRYAKQCSYLTKREINEIVKTHAEHLKTARVIIHVAALIEGDLRRANLEARRLTHSVTAPNRHEGDMRDHSKLGASLREIAALWKLEMQPAPGFEWSPVTAPLLPWMVK